MKVEINRLYCRMANTREITIRYSQCDPLVGVVVHGCVSSTGDEHCMQLPGSSGERLQHSASVTSPAAGWRHLASCMSLMDSSGVSGRGGGDT